MINKKSNNSGASGGNGMQSFTVDYLIECDLYHEYKGGHVVSCCCGEEYYLSPSHNFVQALQLTLALKDQGCPFCNHKKPLTQSYLEWFHENNKKVILYNFEVGEIKLDAYRKPYGWKAVNKTQLRDAWAEKQIGG